MEVGNLFSNVPEKISEELFEVLIRNSSFKLERIISRGHSTPTGQWYDQEKDEWVVLLKGSAGLFIEEEEDAINLKPGDYLLLPAHLRHRVEWTDPDTETIWLALHF